MINAMNARNLLVVKKVTDAALEARKVAQAKAEIVENCKFLIAESLIYIDEMIVKTVNDGNNFFRIEDAYEVQKRFVEQKHWTVQSIINEKEPWNKHEFFKNNAYESIACVVWDIVKEQLEEAGYDVRKEYGCIYVYF